MVVENGASLKTVGKVPRVAQTSAKLMVGESDALGEKESVRNLLGVRVGYVLLIAAWYKSSRGTREVLLVQDSSMGLYLMLRQQLAVALTLLIRPQELVLCLIALSLWKCPQKGNSSYLHSYWFLYL